LPNIVLLTENGNSGARNEIKMSELYELIRSEKGRKKEKKKEKNRRTFSFLFSRFFSEDTKRYCRDNLW